MFEGGGASGGVEAADAAELLTARHARIAREQYLEIESVTDLFIVRCEEDARRAGTKHVTANSLTSKSPGFSG
ncbi:hypothetical protein GS988_14985 [Rhodococcus hoagii]|nr:hypothetical protein [Prescottella equi]